MKTLLTTLLLMNLSLSLLAQQGLVGEYFDGANFERKVGTRIDPNINFTWRKSPPFEGVTPDKCSVRWTGFLTAPESGDYVFSAKVDDGIRVWVDNQLIINSWTMNDMGNFKGNISLQKNKTYSIKVEYFNALFEGEISLMWQLPSQKPKLNGWAGYNTQVIENQYFKQENKKTPPSPKAEKLLYKPAAKPPVIAPQKAISPPSVPPSPKPKNKVLSADTLQKYIPKNVFFERSKSIILENSYSDLDKLGVFLLRYPNLKIKIEGHTDIIGEAGVNQILSEERANIVKDYLIQKGINANRISAKGYGSTRPLINDGSKTGHPENRRVVFIVY